RSSKPPSPVPNHSTSPPSNGIAPRTWRRTNARKSSFGSRLFPVRRLERSSKTNCRRPTPMERTATADRLKQLLERVIAEGGAGERVSAGEIDLQADFAELGINSVDLLEFVLGLEQEFGVRVLDDMLPEDLPANLAGWLEVLLRAESSRAT